MDFLGRELVGARPTRCPRGGAQDLTLGKVLYFQHHPVDAVGEIVAMPGHGVQQLVDLFQGAQPRHLYAETRRGFPHAVNPPPLQQLIEIGLVAQLFQTPAVVPRLESPHSVRQKR